MKLQSKDSQLLEEAYQSIRESQYATLRKITDGGAGHGGHVAVAPDSLEDDIPDASPRKRPKKEKVAPQYSKLATGKDYPQIDKYLHMWYNESPVAGGGGTYAEMQGPIDDSDIRYWFEGDDNAINFFLKNRAALVKVASKMSL